MDWLNQIRADGGAALEAIIYFVIVVLWLIGQTLSKARRKNNRKEPGEPMTDMERDLQEFFDTISGKEDDEDQEPEKPAPAYRPQTQAQRQPEPVRPRPARPQPSPKPPPSRPRWTPQADPIPSPRMPTLAELKAEMEEQDVYGTEASMQRTMGGALSSELHQAGLKFKADTLSIPAMRNILKLGTHRSAGTPPVTGADARSRNSVRQGMAWRVILGPPRALETTPWPD